eukprot:CAMPEP_0168178974 /NCGR_PEP_ID=MMETSP0139_2-20121125/9513_1 /TAXON_ID=44445 /ORGANISM="Pseudo-nitzschia australis, Strain 10249 10 AB" /LENGTH=187 /DNA_ID=CAMNT_0008098607 /DNA_START=80 /DNA_END=643 /DNA_ORIENTATION=+
MNSTSLHSYYWIAYRRGDGDYLCIWVLLVTDSIRVDDALVLSRNSFDPFILFLSIFPDQLATCNDDDDNNNNNNNYDNNRNRIHERTHCSAAQRISFMGTDEEEEVRRLYGSGFAMKLATERRIGNQTTIGSIGGGIPSSNNVMGDILSGRDMQIGFEDTLGVHEFRPTINKMHEDPHMVMERKLGM